MLRERTDEATHRTADVLGNSIDLYDVVELTEDLPRHDLRAGMTGTVVEHLTSGALEVEFTDDHGRTLVSLGLRPDQVVVAQQY